MATDPSGGSSALSLGGVGELVGGAAALGGLGYILSKGPSPLPGEFGTLSNQYAPYQYAGGQQLQAFGSAEAYQGAGDLRSAAAGSLTPEQQAALTSEKATESNQALQMYAGMGRTPTKDTSYLGTSQTIDLNLMKMAQGFVSNNIQAALSEITSGQAFIGEGLQFESAASADLIAAGNAQVQLDKQYSDEVASAFGALGKIFG
jgi:hypothetical protein